MALKPDRSFTNEATAIDFFMNETGEKGEVLVFSGTGGSGAAMDDANAVVTTPSADPSGQLVAGILLNDVVNLDLTRQHINEQKDEVQLGGKVTLLKRGVLVTNMLESGNAPTIGQPAYFMAGAVSLATAIEGRFTNTVVSDLGTAAVNPSNDARSAIYRVGTFKSIKDSDGYIKIDVNIP